jgi:hypothetical protein
MDARVSRAETSDFWAAPSATAGVAAWAAMAVTARLGISRIGAIELLFLFGPLVIVPLGVELGRLMGGGSRLEEVARRVQPLGAAMSIVAMWLPVGRTAGLLALVWMSVCVVLAGDGLLRFGRALRIDADGGVRATLATLGVARIDLAVGGAWLVASRLRMRPMGIQEPIGLLTAVHFHFAGFATATIAAATLAFAERMGPRPWLRRVVMAVAGLPFLGGAGFVISSVSTMAAAVTFSVCVAGLAVYLRSVAKHVYDGTARVMLQVASGTVFAGMVLAAAYAVANLSGSDALTISQMARTHGLLTAVGFCLAGLLGWLVEHSTQARTKFQEHPHPSRKEHGWHGASGVGHPALPSHVR